MSKEKEVKIHLPSPSYWPISVALGMALIAVGVVSTFIISLVGIIIMLVAIAGWTMENRSSNEEEHHE